MHVLTARNVNDAYVQGIQLLRQNGERSQSRAGDVLVYPTPVTTVYSYPMERVLFDPNRDANPFFFLFESLWMLAGRRDGRWLDLFVKDFSSRFAEPDGRIHGAYGHRWRTAFGFDQLDVVVAKLKASPTDRQVVLQMWDARPTVRLPDIDPTNEDEVGCDDLRGSFCDRPCNTHCYLRVREGVLDLTVCCRSNDIIWGAYGANAVHFSVLQEYLAARIGVKVGVLYQISNNYHAYVDTLYKVGTESTNDWYLTNEPTPMVTDPETFDEELTWFMEWIDSYKPGGQYFLECYDNLWFANTAAPLFVAAKLWRNGERRAALDVVEQFDFIALDWRVAVKSWMLRRMSKQGESYV